MKKMKWLYVLLATFLLTSCGTLMQPYQMDSKMKDIELGMTKKKVISILGKDFESAGARMTSEGSIETISYKTASMTENTEGYYLLSFKDGKLVEWFKEKYPDTQPPALIDANDNVQIRQMPGGICLISFTVINLFRYMYPVETDRMTVILNLRFPTSFSVRFDVIHK